MIQRRIEEKIRQALQRSPSVALVGPRQVGKTTLALDIAASQPAIYLDLENWLDLQKIQDVAAFHGDNSDKLIILDEVQRLPEIFTSLRGIIDKERRKGNKAGHFLFLGSASLDLLQQSGESLAGRIAYIELFPIDVTEYVGWEETKLNMLWLRGGFPESLLAASDNDSIAWRRDFVKTYLERDIPQFGPRIPSETLQRFWTMLAHNQAGVLNASNIGRSLDVSSVTVGRYLDLLVDLLLVRRLMPWTTNVGKRLVRSPKVYIRDSGIVHTLLNIPAFNDLLGHPVSGGSWEGFVIENILSVAPPNMQAFYYGTPAGAKIDLILEFSGKEKWAIEIKRSSAPSLSKGYYIACQDVQPQKQYVVYSGSDRFSMGNGITAIPLFDLMQELLQME